MKCPICMELETKGGMCGPCGRSYDRTAHQDGSVREAMEWAARRARMFEVKRWKAKNRPRTVDGKKC